MFFEPVFVLLCSVVFLQTSAIYTKKSDKGTSTEPLDLVDDAFAFLDVLSQTVLGHIFVAQDELVNYSYDLASHSLYTQLSGEVDLLEEQSTLEEQVNNLKDLAIAAETDIGSCLVGSEFSLLQLPFLYRSKLTDCIFQMHRESEQILTDANYAVDVIMSKVQALNFTLSRCPSDDNVCLSTMIVQIQRASTDLPLEIAVELNSAHDRLEVIKVEIVQCADEAVAGLVWAGNFIVAEIAECVNRVLGS